MCGIFAILGAQTPVTKTHERAAESASKLSHRGPDWSGIISFEYMLKDNITLSCAIAHERLQIIDPQGGEQPIVDKENLHILSINGEIYNYKQLMQSDALAPYMQSVLSKSDCEVIIPLWKHYYNEDKTDLVKAAIKLNKDLDGDFAYVLWIKDFQSTSGATSGGAYIVARDPIGVNPLYIGYSDIDGSIVISSEIKAFSETYVTSFREFPPGALMVVESLNSFSSYKKDKESDKEKTFDSWLSANIKFYFTPGWKSKSLDFLPDTKLMVQQKIRELLTEAVRKRLMSDVPIGFLLSGGLDSSLICAIAARLSDKPIKTFSIGLKGSPDLAAARKVAESLKTDHQEFIFTPEQGIAALPNVIYSLETFDVTTCRAATPMFLLARRIKALGIKVLLSGEGSDEAFGGYLYFHKAPNKIELYEETVDKISLLSKYDCLRANKSTAAWGCEIRVGFLDNEFLSYVMSIDPAYKMIVKNGSTSATTTIDSSSDATVDSVKGGPMEKWILRESFKGYLTDEILYRQKEQFSDGVGYNWIDSLKRLTDVAVSEAQLQDASTRFPEKTPKTKEAYYYRTLFEKRLPHPEAFKIVPWSRSVACSTERALQWDEKWQTMDEPSGRAVSVHNDKL